MALASLAAWLRRRGHEVTALDLNIDLYKKLEKSSPEAWDLIGAKSFWADPRAAARFVEANGDYLKRQADRILASGAKLVGFSIYQSSVYVSLHLAGLLKKKNRAVTIVFGGPHASRETEGKNLIEDGNVDFVVQGEGEVTLAEIIENKKARTFCKGALLRKNGKALDCGDRELVKDLDSLPFPDFSDYDFNDYTGPFKIPISFSRGCCNKCVYCNDHLYWKRFRSRTAASVYSEILTRLRDHPAESFFSFQDSLVNGNIKELEKLADLIIKGGLKLRWHGQAVIRKEMTYELLLKLKKSGCMALAYGVETASVPLMLKAGKVLAKDADPNKIIRDGFRAGVGSIVNLMFGLPGEKEADFRKTLEFIKRNRKHIVVIPQPAFCSIYPGTYAHKHPDELGLDLKNGEYWEAKDGSNTYLTRLRRFEELCGLACELKIPSFYPSPELLNRNELLGGYYLHAGDVKKAVPHILRAIKKESLEISAFQRLEAPCKKAGLQDLYKKCLVEILEWKKSVKNAPVQRSLEQPDLNALVKEELAREKGRYK